MPTEAEIEAAAKSDAAFDGRTFDVLSRADRERYRERSRLALAAAAEIRERMRVHALNNAKEIDLDPHHRWQAHPHRVHLPARPRPAIRLQRSGR